MIQFNSILKFIIKSVTIYINPMFTVYLIKVVWVETLAFALALIKCYWVAKCLEKLFYKIIKELFKIVLSTLSKLSMFIS